MRAKELIDILGTNPEGIVNIFRDNGICNPIETACITVDDHFIIFPKHCETKWVDKGNMGKNCG